MILCREKNKSTYELSEKSLSNFDYKGKKVLLKRSNLQASEWLEFEVFCYRNVLLCTREKTSYVCVFENTIAEFQRQLHFSKYTQNISPGVYKLQKSVFNLRDVRLKRDKVSFFDMKSLESGKLTDRIINLSWLLVKDSAIRKACGYLNPYIFELVSNEVYDVAQAMMGDILNLNFFYLPVCARGHWILVVYDARSKKINVCDSLGSVLRKPIKSKLSRIASWIDNSSNWNFWRVITDKVQTDGVSCGIFVIHWMINHVLYSRFDNDRFDIQGYRKYLDLFIRVQDIN